MNTKGNIQDIYPLTTLQEGMLFHSLMDGASGVYANQTTYRLRGHLHIPTAERSLNTLLERYDVLRTAFIYKGLDRPLQVVLNRRKLDFHYADLSDRPSADHESCIDAMLTADRQRLFDLEKDVLIRVTILRLSDDEHVFIWSHHHIIMDGWCTGILVSDFYDAYHGYQQGRAIHLPAVTPYGKYIQWLERQDKEVVRQYWRQYLDGYHRKAGFPQQVEGQYRDGPYANAQMVFEVEKEATSALTQLAQGAEVTLNTVIQSLWGVLLAKTNGCTDVIFGAVVSGRPPQLPGVERMVGLFINTIPIRVTYTPRLTFTELLWQVHREAGRSKPYHYYSLDSIQAESGLGKELFDHLVVFENYPDIGRIDAGRADGRQFLEVTAARTVSQTNYGLQLVVGPGERLHVRLQYNANVYSAATMEGIQRNLLYLAGRFTATPATPLADVDLLLPPGEEAELEDMLRMIQAS